jgi:hypothetical protein
MHSHHHLCRDLEAELQFDRDKVRPYNCERRVHTIGLSFVMQPEVFALPEAVRIYQKKNSTD